MPEYVSDQLINVTKVYEETSETAQKAMHLLQTGDMSTLVPQDMVSPDIVRIMQTFNTEPDVLQEMTLPEAISNLSLATDISDKKSFMGVVVKRSFDAQSLETLETGASFCQEKTYDRLGFSFYGGEEWENDEALVQGLTVANFHFENTIYHKFEKTGKQNIYRGNPELWTPLNKFIPEDQHIKIKKAMEDYVEPNVYENKYQTKERRQSGLKPQEPQKDYIPLPRRSNYEFDNE